MFAGASCKTLVIRLGKAVRVKPFSDNLGAIEKLPIWTVDTSYVHPISGERFTLIFHEALIFEDTLKSSLINLKFDKTSSYSFVGIEEKTGDIINLPLSLRGIISYLPTTFPSEEQLDTCRQITLTSEDIWDPYTQEFEDKKEGIYLVVTSKPTVYGGEDKIPNKKTSHKVVTIGSLEKTYALTH